MRRLMFLIKFQNVFSDRTTVLDENFLVFNHTIRPCFVESLKAKHPSKTFPYRTYWEHRAYFKVLGYILKVLYMT